jgi:protein-disulfide isomerase
MSDETESAMLATPVSAQRDHVRGSASAAVTLVEYGDYECPYCGEAHPVVQELLAQQGEHVLFVFRNFPLSQMHPHAEHAAEAAEAAGAQRRFWEMHDLLYERQDALEDDDLLSYAAEIALGDVGRFQVELARHTHAARVREDFMGGVRSGVNGTPTFFINGRRHDGPFDLRTLTEAVTLATGAPPASTGRGHHRPHLP